MPDGLDPKRIKKGTLGAPPPSEGFISNKFEGLNVDQGEEYPLDPAIEPNKFPRETGSDSADEFAGGGFAG